MSNTAYISKSKFLHGLQCPKLLWCSYNAKNLFPEVDAALQGVFEQGREVGSIAKKLFHGGVEIESDPADLGTAIRLTAEKLALRKPLFEAAFSANGGFARTDILNPVSKNEWDIVEVKSTTDIKEIHIPDLAFQAWVLAGAGIKVQRCLLCHINGDYVRHGEIDPAKFFNMLDVTAEVLKLTGEMDAQVGQMGKIIRAKKCPDIQIGRQCDNPYTCPLHDHCWSFLPSQNVLELYDDKKGRGYDLLQRDVLRIADIPGDYALSAKQEIQRTTARTGKPHIERPKVEEFLQALEYPLQFLDFETFSTAIPLFDGTSPYQQIPFQFSLHVVHQAGSKAEHRKFLAEGRGDPRGEFMRQLNAAAEPKGTIIVFNASFEKGRLKECSEALPKYKSFVADVTGRVVDLLLPFRGFIYYHPNQRGSASMKWVLPAITGKNYKELEIQEGGTASREFVRVTYGNVSAAERQRVRKALDLYCGQDTEGMIWILAALKSLLDCP